MPQIILDINPAAALTRAVDALCALNGYQTLIGGNPNPETKNNFAKRMLAVWLKARIVEYESGLAAEAARATATASADSLSIT